MNPPQYAFRAQKTTGVAEGPSWAVTPQIPADTAAVRCYAYSSDGEWFAYALASTVHLFPSSSSSSSSPRVIEQAGVIALSFSPLSSTLFTFERPVKSDTVVHRNVKAWNVKTGEEAGGWYHRSHDDWQPIVTSDESHRLLASNSDILIFSPYLAPKPCIRLKLNGQIKGLFLSQPTALPEGSTNSKPVQPSSQPALAVWIGEKQGAPASVALYPLNALLGKEALGEATVTRDMPPTTARKAFYKADKLQVKWNPAGTMALFMTHMDVDQTGKSYYGETNLYCVSLDGSFDGMVDLDKEGPIYDYVWSPTSREFVVCYGYMPARVQLFDMKAKPVHSFGSGHRNFLSYQPQGRLLLSAGFGNLAGGVDVWDISTRNKVAEFKAANSSHCEWSADGRYILTATLSPRLRVDNGVKIWWCGGQLLHVHLQEELYQASFRPKKLAQADPFPSVIPKAPEANESVALLGPKGESSNGAAAKPAGAYRPPGARGTVASDVYTRRDDDAPSSGASTPTPMFRGGKPSDRYRSAVPGAPPGGSPATDDKKKKQRSKKNKGEEANGGGSGAATPDVAAAEKLEALKVEDSPVEDANQKKVRNLLKKLKAIEDLKDRQAKGEVLEKNQEKKIEAEKSVRDEIKSLGGEA